MRQLSRAKTGQIITLFLLIGLLSYLIAYLIFPDEAGARAARDPALIGVYNFGVGSTSGGNQTGSGTDTATPGNQSNPAGGAATVPAGGAATAAPGQPPARPTPAPPIAAPTPTGTVVPVSGPTPVPAPGQGGGGLNVTIGAQTGTSNFQAGYSLVDVANTGLAKGVLTVQNTYIQAWGLDDPWPDPNQPEPTNWGTLDRNMQQILQSGATPMISLSEAPWWMKGQLNGDGSTTLLTASQEWSSIAYSSRILDNKMDAWLHLVQRVAERYMAPPYNVRRFQVWNELKGYYNPRTNAWDYDASPGNPGGPNAQHGYTYMYNQVYGRLTQVAQQMGIGANNIVIGGPYVVIDSWSGGGGSPSALREAYGTIDQRSLDVVTYWLQHKSGAGFIAIDGSNSNKDGVNSTDAFTASQKFADVIRWLRSLDANQYPGATTLPVWLAEWYTQPFDNTGDDNAQAAVKTYAMMEFIRAGGAVSLTWGGQGDGTSGSGLWTASGNPYPWYNCLKTLGAAFPPGTPLMTTSTSAPGQLAALASDRVVLLINRTTQSLTVSVAGQTITLGAYAVTLVQRH